MTVGTTSADSFTIEYLPEIRAGTVFFMFASNTLGRSGFSMLFRSFSQVDMSIPSTPVNLSILTLTNSSVTLQWKHPFGEVRINVCILPYYVSMEFN